MHIEPLHSDAEVAGYLAGCAPKLLWENDRNGKSAFKLAIENKQYSVMYALLQKTVAALDRRLNPIEEPELMASYIEEVLLPAIEELKDQNTSKAQEESTIEKLLISALEIDRRLHEALF